MIAVSTAMRACLNGLATRVLQRQLYPVDVEFTSRRTSSFPRDTRTRSIDRLCSIKALHMKRESKLC